MPFRVQGVTRAYTRMYEYIDLMRNGELLLQRKQTSWYEIKDTMNTVSIETTIYISDNNQDFSFFLDIDLFAVLDLTFIASVVETEEDDKILK